VTFVGIDPLAQGDSGALPPYQTPLTVDLAFQPGPPAQGTLSAPSPLTAGAEATDTGRVADVYGNPVNPSTLDATATAGTIQSPVATAAGGAYSAAYTAPQKLTSAPGTGQGVTVGVRSVAGSFVASKAIVVNPGPPASVTASVPGPVAAGQSEPVSGTVTDAYGNAVLNGTAVALGASAGSVTASTYTTGGAYQADFTAPTKLASAPGTGEDVTITATAGSADGSVTAVVDPGPAATVTLQTYSAKVAPGQSVVLTGTAADVYGNAVLNGTVADLTATGGGVAPTATTAGGAFTATWTAPQTPGTYTITASVNGHSASVTETVSSPVPQGAHLSLTITANGAGGYTLSGQVLTAGGQPVAGAPVTLTATANGVTVTLTATTDSAGDYRIAFTPPASSGAVTLSGTAGGGSSASGLIDPLISGSQPWTDTGIAVNAGQEVFVQSSGPWALALEAKVGPSGVPVAVGAKGAFVSGVSGDLYLGTGGATQSGAVDALVGVWAPAQPSLSLQSAAGTAVAPGAAVTLQGSLTAGGLPVVGAPVTLTTTAGGLSPSPISGSSSGTGGITISSVTDSNGVITVQGNNLPVLSGGLLAPYGLDFTNFLFRDTNPWSNEASGNPYYPYSPDWGIQVFTTTSTTLSFTTGGVGPNGHTWDLYLLPTGQQVSSATEPVASIVYTATSATGMVDAVSGSASSTASAPLPRTITVMTGAGGQFTAYLLVSVSGSANVTASGDGAAGNLTLTVVSSSSVTPSSSGSISISSVTDSNGVITVQGSNLPVLSSGSVVNVACVQPIPLSFCGTTYDFPNFLFKDTQVGEANGNPYYPYTPDWGILVKISTPSELSFATPNAPNGHVWDLYLLPAGQQVSSATQPVASIVYSTTSATGTVMATS